MTAPVDNGFPASPPTFAAMLSRGQALEDEGQFEAAIAAYDQAIAWHGNQASAADPDVSRESGLAWMNRGNALQKRGGQENLSTAVDAYDRAIVFFETLPVETEPKFRNHLGAAWLNRGHSRIAAADLMDAIASFEAAIAQFAFLPLEASPHYRLNLTGAWTNLAHAWLNSSPERARAAARSALDLLHPVAPAHELFATMSLRARRALVMALSPMLITAESAGESTQALAAEASDAIDDGLVLARQFGPPVESPLYGLAERLFRLGAQLYRVHQPQFLAEFLLENLGPPAFANDATFRAIASDAIQHALQDLQRPRLLLSGAAETEKLLATSHSLRAFSEKNRRPDR